ncbi:hypothetical protein NX786_25245 [Telluria mixta]|uniref:Uncharacterized protein n=1 Tax=Telluria mixta TaxID=34071 RepID=A0ABT2C5I1_9BURK|nr:hypothetical protein [Telluria mixta]MCS0632645.1 hypothetical protein [Telluria mixta]WEM99061.1 hypothetical protein P0M04_15530 [Telluria mixta]
MATESKTGNDDLTVQEHCIDLPGESVQCWIGGGTDKLKVILRKHRDVIFDIRLSNGGIYTVESTESDFYVPRDKKLIHAPQHAKVTFKDGERFHIWLSRGFRGSLILKSTDRVIYKVTPSEWDKQEYSGEPKEKPAPIIIAIAPGATTPAPLQKTKTQSTHNILTKSVASKSISTPPIAAPMHSPDLSCPVVCVIDGKVEGMPAHIAEHFKKGGDHSGFSDIDPNHIATRNWLWGQGAGTGAYIKDNWDWLRASLDSRTSRGFKLVKAQVHYVGGKVRFYFSGYSNSNIAFGRGGFGPSHDRIMTIFAGAGKTTSTFGSTLKGVAGSFENTALVSFIFGTATAIAEWKEDAQKDGYDLAAGLITTTIKTILAAAVTTLVVAIIVWLVMIALGAAIPVIAVGAITIGVGFVANYLIESADKLAGRVLSHDQSNSDGTASIVAHWMRETGNSAIQMVHQNWNYLMHKMVNDYQEIVF